MKRNENGEINILLIVVVLVSLIAVGFVVAFVWAFGERDRYKNDSDSIVATAVEEAKTEQESTTKAWCLENEKLPNLTFSGPADFGSVKFDYPKTWASYNVDNSNSKYSVYFNPKMVPSTSNKESTFALRITVENKSYESVLKTFETAAGKGEVTIKPITVGGDKNFGGMRIDGQIDKTTKASIAVFRIRDKSLILRTDGDSFVNDFNETILKTLEFQP